VWPVPNLETSQALHIAEHVKKLNATLLRTSTGATATTRFVSIMIFNLYDPRVEIITPIRDPKTKAANRVNICRIEGGK